MLGGLVFWKVFQVEGGNRFDLIIIVYESLLCDSGDVEMDEFVFVLQVFIVRGEQEMIVQVIL